MGFNLIVFSFCLLILSGKVDDSLIPDAIKLPDSCRLVAGFVSAAIITFVSIPTIVLISKHKKLYDVPNDRTSHLFNTPTLGGCAVLAGFTIATIIFSYRSSAAELAYILGGLIPLFFIGIKDDILIIDPKTKIIGQIFASLIVIWIGGIYLSSFYDLLGIDNINSVIGIIVTLFLFLILINGFNFIDGIDGLASAIGFIASVFYGTWFILTGNINYAILGFSLAGALGSFFYFNVFGKRHKIFLGDTGSMVIGFVEAILTVKFLEFNLIAEEKFRFTSAPAISVGLLIIPLFDTLKVFVLRLGKGKSPFKADRNHIHHSLLALGLTHLNATIIIVIVNLFLVILALLFKNFGILKLTAILLLVMTGLSYILHLIVRRHKNKMLLPGTR